MICRTLGRTHQRVSLTCRASFLTARQIRLKMKPVLSLRTTTGRMPIDDMNDSTAASVSSEVAKIRGIVEALSLEVATPSETRQLLALKGPGQVKF